MGKHMDSGTAGRASYALDDDQGSHQHDNLTASNGWSWDDSSQGVAVHADLSSGSAMATTTTWSSSSGDSEWNGQSLGASSSGDSTTTTAPVKGNMTAPDLSGIVSQALSGASLDSLFLPFVTAFGVLERKECHAPRDNTTNRLSPLSST